MATAEIQLVDGEIVMAGNCQPIYKKESEGKKFRNVTAEVKPGDHCFSCPFKARCSESTVPISIIGNA